MKYVDRFTAAQAGAREANRGFWGACSGGHGSSENDEGDDSGGTGGVAGGTGGSGGGGNCDANYKGACIPPYPPDLDCTEISASGFESVGSDPSLHVAPYSWCTEADRELGPACLSERQYRDLVIPSKAQLIGNELVDEYRLMIEPILLGGGTRLFPTGATARPLTLVESVTTPTGVLICTYRPAASA